MWTKNPNNNEYINNNNNNNNKRHDGVHKYTYIFKETGVQLDSSSEHSLSEVILGNVMIMMTMMMINTFINAPA